MNTIPATMRHVAMREPGPPDVLVIASKARCRNRARMTC